MGRKKKFIDKKKAVTFQLLARDSSDPNYCDSPGGDRVFVRVDNNPYSDNSNFDDDENPKEDSNSVFADASGECDGNGDGVGSYGKPLPENVRRDILELGFPDDGYNYLTHLREIKNSGGGSAFYHNPKAKLDQLPHDVKAYDASRVEISHREDDAEANDKSIYSVASKAVNVRLQKALDPEVAGLGSAASERVENMAGSKMAMASLIQIRPLACLAASHPSRLVPHPPDLVRWIKREGVFVHQAVKISQDSISGLGLVAAERIAKGSDLIALPHHVPLSLELDGGDDAASSVLADLARRVPGCLRVLNVSKMDTVGEIWQTNCGR